ncbi:DUF423 domain-containing protein [Alteromonas sp. 5E99-2]|uniref:DUF423 domain-containing protein n=1 Tax=Alteromonas sp. 5E99-2 TaxID=2817683 RepID=UPI001A99F825|nr:DUF423 domain-containing protein [Alteromonas sp. 5E99-2]MBO1254868.1 DUF423 domain-containing protein [Alteromonas sp. 5E99-2]
MTAQKLFLIISLFILASAVGAGAFGAHGLKDSLSAQHFATFETAVRYQMYHGLGILMVSIGQRLFQQKAWLFGQTLLVIGTILFSTTLYFYIGTGIRAFAIATPLGGSALILGWLWLIVGAWKGNKE